MNAKKALRGLYNQPHIQEQVNIERMELKRNTPPKRKNEKSEIITNEEIPDCAKPTEYKNLIR